MDQLFMLFFPVSKTSDEGFFCLAGIGYLWCDIETKSHRQRAAVSPMLCPANRAGPDRSGVLIEVGVDCDILLKSTALN